MQFREMALNLSQKGRLLQEITPEKRTFCASDEPQILA
jgi:hypothetical protein